MTLESLIPVLQVAVGPAILISGDGLLLLTMTNRLGRTIDRSRQLVGLVKSDDDQERENAQAQIKILWRRATLLRSAIFMAATSALMAALLVITIFLSAIWSWQVTWLISGTFVGCMFSLMSSLVWFLRDINLSLHALAIETGRRA
jgi:hypothetical protein